VLGYANAWRRSSLPASDGWWAEAAVHSLPGALTGGQHGTPLCQFPCMRAPVHTPCPLPARMLIDMGRKKKPGTCRSSMPKVVKLLSASTGKAVDVMQRTDMPFSAVRRAD